MAGLSIFLRSMVFRNGKFYSFFIFYLTYRMMNLIFYFIGKNCHFAIDLKHFLKPYSENFCSMEEKIFFPQTAKKFLRQTLQRFN